MNTGKGREGPRPALSLLRLQGFHAGSRPETQSGPQTLPYSLGSGWVSQQSLSEIFLLLGKKKKEKIQKHQETQKRFGAGSGASLALDP